MDFESPNHNSYSDESATVQAEDPERVPFISRQNSDWNTSSLQKYGVDFSSDILYMFAFDVGQGNCFILRKGNDAFVIDAGCTGTIPDIVIEKISHALNGAYIRHVFVTHADEDHCSLLNKTHTNTLFSYATKPDNDHRCDILLGGCEDNYKDKTIFSNGYTSTTFSNSVTDKSMDFNINGVKFEVFNIDSPDDWKANPSSLVIKVSYSGKNLLFTGDAEGKTLGELLSKGDNIKQYLNKIKLSQCLPKNVYDLNDELLIQCDENKYKRLREELSSNNAFKHFLPEYNIPQLPNVVRDALGNIDLVVLPHHGTDTEKSQRWIGYFAGKSQKTVFLVSSSPFVLNHRPVRSTIEIAPKDNSVPAHIVAYTHDGSLPVSFKETTKPIYVTGAAPGGLYCFSISNNSLSLLDVCRRDDHALFRWFGLFSKDAPVITGHKFENNKLYFCAN